MEKFLRDNITKKYYGYSEYRGMFNWEDYKLGEGPIWFSFELETGTNTGITNEQLEKAYDMFPVLCASDSSIPATYKYEWISQPMDWKWFIEHKQEFIDWIKYLKSIGLLSHSLNDSNGNGCGLHIHVTKVDGWEKAVGAMWLFMQTYRHQHAKVCGRDFVYYAENVLNYRTPSKMEFGKSTEWLLETAKQFSHEHSMAINLQHNNDIEFRQSVGTLNEETLIARFEYFNNLYKLALTYDRIDRFTWSRVVKGEYISKYARKVDAISIAVPYDTTKIIKQYTNQLLVIKKNIITQITAIINMLPTSSVSLADQITSTNTLMENINTLMVTTDRLDARIKEIKNKSTISRTLDRCEDKHVTKAYQELKTMLKDIEIPVLQDTRLSEEV